MAERLSIDDGTIYSGYSNHIQRYTFAAERIAGKKVLDAGCGTGYGSAYLAANGAASVTAVDISDEAIEESTRLYRRSNLRFLTGDVEALGEIAALDGPFDLIVNLENLEHLHHPERFVAGASELLHEDGCLVISTPNGAITERDEEGKIKNEFHTKEYTSAELAELLGPHFSKCRQFGQWKTPERIARLHHERNAFALVCENYYNPYNRLWRASRRLFGKPCAAEPAFVAEGMSYPWEFTIQPIDSSIFPWEPDVILAVCQK